MNKNEFNILRDRIYANTGIKLEDKKKTLLETRLAKRLRILNLNNFSEYIDYLDNATTLEEWNNLVEEVSTNTTHFFREEAHFEILKDYLKQEVLSGNKKIRMWCGAASSGQEPWSLMITARRAGISHSFDFKLLSTDINRTVLEQGRKGVYNSKEISSLPVEFKTKYFSNNGDFYTIKQSLKPQAYFACMNLKKSPYLMSGPFDVIFIRNVMIYFDNSLRTVIVKECKRLLKQGGLLFVGHAESLVAQLVDGFEKVAPSVFRKL